jgi:hypothetical protein
MTNYVNPLTGQTISPSTVGYEALTIAANTSLQWPINSSYTTSTPVVAAIMQVTATASGLQLQLPPANQVSTGQAVLVENVGTLAFTVTDNSGNTIIVINSTIAQYVFLTDNSTVNGVWSTISFNTTGSTGTAAGLAGYGLQAISNTLNTVFSEGTIASSTTLTASYQSQFLVWTGGAGSITLPSSAASSIGNGWYIAVRNGGTGTLTLTPAGTDTIDGNSNKQLNPTESLVIVSNGNNGWYTFAYGRNNNFIYTQLVIGVTGGTLTLSATQYANVVQAYTGTLTSNQIVVLPSTVQIYYVQNSTSGSYSLTFKTSSSTGTTVSVPQGQTLAIICDGTNVYNASSAAASSLTTLTINPGSATNPSLNFSGWTTTGMYSPGSGQVAWALAGANAMTLNSSGLTVVNGISGGVF